MYDARFSPDGRWLAARDKDQTIHIWEAEAGKKTASLQTQPKPEQPLIFTFSPDGKCLLTGSYDTHTAVLWETRTGIRLAELGGGDGLIRTLHFAPDGKRVIVGSVWGPARLYATDVCGSAKDLLDLAERRVPRQLTNGEREKYQIPPRRR